MSRARIPAVVLGDLNILRCLAGRRIPLSVVACDAREPTLRSRHADHTFVIASPSDPGRAVAELEALSREFRERPVLYFGTDATLLMISRARERLEKCFRFALSSAELVETVVDKARFAVLAEQRGLPVPRSVRSEELEEDGRLLDRVGLPCAFKPSVHIGWLRGRAAVDRMPRKAIRADTREQATALCDELARLGPFVVQQWVEGGEDCVMSFHCYADESSRVLGWFVGRKVRTYPKEAGVSTYLELAVDPEVTRLGLEIVARLGIVGPLKIDFKRDARSGELYVLEINARFTLWCYLGMASGVNLPAIAHAHLCGHEIPQQGSYSTDVRWLSFGNDLRAFLRSYLPSGELGVLEWVRSYRGKKVYDVFSWTDPAPSVASAFDYATRAATRLLGGRAPVPP